MDGIPITLNVTLKTNVIRTYLKKKKDLLLFPRLLLLRNVIRWTFLGIDALEEILQQNVSEHTSHWLVQTKCPYFFLALLLFHHFVCSSEIFVLIRQRSWPCMKENGFTSFRFYVTCHLDISDKKLNCQTMLKWMYTNVSYFSRYLGMLGITYLIDLMNTMSSNTLCLSNGTLSVVVY